MEDQIKEKLLLVKEKFQRFSLYLAKQYVRTKRDIHRMLHPRDGSTWRGKKLRRQLLRCRSCLAFRHGI